MKLANWQIIGLILLVIIHFRGGDFINPTPYKPDLMAEEMESKGLAGMLVLVDDSKPVNPVVPTPIPDPQGAPSGSSNSAEDAPVVREFSGRVPRTILLTDTKNCPPCRQVDSMIVDVLKTPKYKKVGWDVGRTEDKPLQVVDLSKDPQLFYEIAEKLGRHNPHFSLSVPTFIRVGGKGQIQNTSTGSMSLGSFFEFSGSK